MQFLFLFQKYAHFIILNFKTCDPVKSSPNFNTVQSGLKFCTCFIDFIIVLVLGRENYHWIFHNFVKKVFDQTFFWLKNHYFENCFLPRIFIKHILVYNLFIQKCLFIKSYNLFQNSHNLSKKFVCFQNNILEVTFPLEIFIRNPIEKIISFFKFP